MKKFFAFALACVMVLSACSRENKDPSIYRAETIDESAINTEVLANIVLDSIPFPAMSQNDDENYVLEYWGIDPSHVESFTAYQQMLSVDLNEVLVVKVVENKEPDVKSALINHRQKLIDATAFYPEQMKSATGTAVGSKKGYVYLVAHEDGQKGVDVISAKIK